MADNNIAIKVSGVCKEYKDVKAVNNLSFQVLKSHCFGLLGPNGAGKTTMMKMLYGKTLRAPKTGGEISVLGFDPLKNDLEIKYLSGIVPQEDNLDQELSVLENLKIYAGFYGLKGKVIKDRILELLEFMELSSKINSKIKELSGGMKRRLIIARALINEPQLLFLDEPTTGLDPQVRHLIWSKLRALKKEGVSLLLTTHYMEEAFQLCDELIIMHQGQKILEGIPQTLIQKNIEAYVLEIPDKSQSEIKNLPKDFRKEQHESTIYIYSDDLVRLQEVSLKLKSGSYYLRQSNLEDVFLKFTGRSLNE